MTNANSPFLAVANIVMAATPIFALAIAYLTNAH